MLRPSSTDAAAPSDPSRSCSTGWRSRTAATVILPGIRSDQPTQHGAYRMAAKRTAAPPTIRLWQPRSLPLHRSQRRLRDSRRRRFLPRRIPTCPLDCQTRCRAACSFHYSPRHRVAGRHADPDLEILRASGTDPASQPFIVLPDGSGHRSGPDEIAGLVTAALRRTYWLSEPPDITTVARYTIENYENLKRACRGDDITYLGVLGFAGLRTPLKSRVTTAWGQLRPAPAGITAGFGFVPHQLDAVLLQTMTGRVQMSLETEPEFGGPHEPFREWLEKATQVATPCLCSSGRRRFNRSAVARLDDRGCPIWGRRWILRSLDGASNEALRDGRSRGCGRKMDSLARRTAHVVDGHCRPSSYLQYLNGWTEATR